MKCVNRVGSAFLRALVKRMRALGLNQSDLARRLKCSRAYVSRVLQGDVNISFAAAAHFCRALKLDFVPGVSERNDDDTSPSHSNSSLQLSPTPTPIPNSSL